MSKVLIHFYIVSSKEVLEARIDDSLTFKQCLKMLDLSIKTAVYDKNKQIFLDMEVPISQFNIKRYIALELL